MLSDNNIFDIQFASSENLYKQFFKDKEVRFLEAHKTVDFDNYQWSLGHNRTLIYYGYMSEPLREYSIDSLEYALYVSDNKIEDRFERESIFKIPFKKILVYGMVTKLPAVELKTLFINHKVYFLYDSEVITALGFNRD